MKKLLFVITVFFTFPAVEQPLAADMIRLNTGINDPFTTSDKTGFINLLIKETFARIGIQAEVIVYQNSAKSLENANNGIDDGAALRIEGLEKKFPNLIRVPEKLMDNDFVAYSYKDHFNTNNWTDLDNFKIAFIKGWQIFQNNLTTHKAITKTRNARQMLDLLNAGKVDFALYERWQGLWLAKQFGIEINASEPPLAKRQTFMYLNIKHSDLVEKASVALREIKQDGTYKKIFDMTLGNLR